MTKEREYQDAYADAWTEAVAQIIAIRRAEGRNPRLVMMSDDALAKCINSPALEVDHLRTSNATRLRLHGVLVQRVISTNGIGIVLDDAQYDEWLSHNVPFLARAAEEGRMMAKPMTESEFMLRSRLDYGDEESTDEALIEMFRRQDWHDAAGRIGGHLSEMQTRISNEAHELERENYRYELDVFCGHLRAALHKGDVEAARKLIDERVGPEEENGGTTKA